MYLKATYFLNWVYMLFLSPFFFRTRVEELVTPFAQVSVVVAASRSAT